MMDRKRYHNTLDSPHINVNAAFHALPEEKHAEDLYDIMLCFRGPSVRSCNFPGFSSFFAANIASRFYRVGQFPFYFPRPFYFSRLFSVPALHPVCEYETLRCIDAIFVWCHVNVRAILKSFDHWGPLGEEVIMCSRSSPVLCPARLCRCFSLCDDVGVHRDAAG